MRAVFIDVETTGLDFDRHVPLDVGAVVVDLHNMSCIATYYELIKCYSIQWDHADHQALEVNGFDIDNHFASKESWEVGNELLEFLVHHGILRGQSIFICQNPSFDRIFIHKLISQKKMNDFNLPYHWLDLASMYWIKALDINKPVNGHTLKKHSPISLSKDTIASMLGIPKEAKPHKGLQGAEHLFECYKALVKLPSPLPL